MLRDIEFIKGVTRLRNPLFDPKKPDPNIPEFVDQEIYIQPEQITMFYELPDEKDSACVFLKGAPDLPAAVRGPQLTALKKRIIKS